MTSRLEVSTEESQEIRDAVVRTGIADGAGESYDALEAVLADL
jgi:hypothetical protein